MHYQWLGGRDPNFSPNTHTMNTYTKVMDTYMNVSTSTGISVDHLSILIDDSSFQEP